MYSRFPNTSILENSAKVSMAETWCCRVPRGWHHTDYTRSKLWECSIEMKPTKHDSYEPCILLSAMPSVSDIFILKSGIVWPYVLVHNNNKIIIVVIVGQSKALPILPLLLPGLQVERCGCESASKLGDLQCQLCIWLDPTWLLLQARVCPEICLSWAVSQPTRLALSSSNGRWGPPMQPWSCDVCAVFRFTLVLPVHMVLLQTSTLECSGQGCQTQESDACNPVTCSGSPCLNQTRLNLVNC